MSACRWRKPSGPEGSSKGTATPTRPPHPKSHALRILLECGDSSPLSTSERWNAPKAAINRRTPKRAGEATRTIHTSRCTRPACPPKPRAKAGSPRASSTHAFRPAPDSHHLPKTIRPTAIPYPSRSATAPKSSTVLPATSWERNSRCGGTSLAQRRTEGGGSPVGVGGIRAPARPIHDSSCR